ncbi:MAG: hypothetical protein Fues2KO_14510 [Fuerstiella sp.]
MLFSIAPVIERSRQAFPRRVLFTLVCGCLLPGCATFDQIIGYEPYPPCESCGSPIAPPYHEHGSASVIPPDPYNDVHLQPHPQDSSDNVYQPNRPGTVAGTPPYSPHSAHPQQQPPYGQQQSGPPQQVAQLPPTTPADNAQLQSVQSDLRELKDLVTQATSDRDVLERRVTSLNNVVKGIQQENRLLQQQLEDIEEKASLQHQVEMEKLLAIQRFVDRLDRNRTSTAAATHPAFQ